MANELRKRQLGIGGLIEDNPLSSGATLLTSAGLAAITGGVASTEHMAIVINPDGDILPPEIAYITDLTSGAGATGATGLLRAQEGTTQQNWPQDTPWVHALTLRDEVEVYNVTKATVHTDNPQPTVDTLIDSMTLTLPARPFPRLAIISASVFYFNYANQSRIAVQADGTTVFPEPGSGLREVGITEGTTTGYWTSFSGVGWTVPGDNATHVIRLVFQASGSTAGVDWHQRSLSVVCGVTPS